MKVAGGLALLGPAILLFAGSMVAAGLLTGGSKLINFFTGGGPIGMIADSVKTLTPVLPQLVQIGPALNNYASGIIAFGKAVSSVDVAKAEKLKEVIKALTVKGKCILFILRFFSDINNTDRFFFLAFSNLGCFFNKSFKIF